MSFVRFVIVSFGSNETVHTEWQWVCSPDETSQHPVHHSMYTCINEFCMLAFTCMYLCINECVTMYVCMYLKISYSASLVPLKCSCSCIGFLKSDYRKDGSLAVVESASVVIHTPQSKDTEPSRLFLWRPTLIEAPHEWTIMLPCC